jgi:RES domain-containing protein
MRVWRMSNFADLSGDGGLAAAGRWYSRGRRVVDLSDHPASALLEVLVHLQVDADDLPATYRLLAIDVADTATIDEVDPVELPEQWHRDVTVSRARGDAWLRSGRTALLRVPSAIVPSAFNWLLDPTHADAARVRITDIRTVPFDRRLLR